MSETPESQGSSELESCARELIRANPEYPFKHVLARVESKLGIKADGEARRRLGKIYAEERARAAAPRERLLGIIMLLFGLVLSGLGTYWLFEGLLGAGALVGVVGLGFLGKGIIGLFKGRTSAVGVQEAIEERALKDK